MPLASASSKTHLHLHERVYTTAVKLNADSLSMLIYLSLEGILQLDAEHPARWRIWLSTGNMKALTYTGITKPGLLLSCPELSILSIGFNQVNPCMQAQMLIEKKNGLMSRVRCAVSERMYASSTSVDSSLTKPVTVQSDNRRARTSSLYSRPSLLEMKKEKIANRARVYEFLRGLGIVPDELDGLELPVTVDVMRERVDFLHKLGLTIEDINNYSLVLGCSVKKNMIPVLDYLGKLGVRKSTFTEFLRRYPQVLHSSVVVDIQPVVKYLQGLDIKPNDIPRVLEKYPEVLGFKLEGTMSTSVAFLIGIGVARREIGGLLTRYPEILGMRVGRVIKPFVEYLESIGIPRLAVARLIERGPHILGFSLDDRVKPNVNILLEFGVREEFLASVVAQYPEIIGIELKPKLVTQQGLFSSEIDVSPDDFSRVVEKMPQVVSLSQASLLKHVDFLKECGFSIKQVEKMVVSCPQLLALNLDIMRMSFDYFQMKMERDLDELVAFPAFFTYGLASRIRPRHQMVAKKGLKCSLAWLLNCSDDKFEDRMSYDSLDIEEMEMEPSFDMKTLLEPREEFFSDDDESDDEYM
ncbi:Transcription termination factor mterf4, chloroplastic [Asimina triloba]